MFCRGAVLIMGGITLNVWVGAIFYHPVEQHMKRVPKIKEDVDNHTEEENEIENLVNHNSNPTPVKPNQKVEIALPENNDKSSFIRSASSIAVQNYRSSVSPVSSRERKISVPTSKEMSRVSYRSVLNSQIHSTPSLHAVPKTTNNRSMDFYSHSRLPVSRLRTNAASLPRRSPSTSSFQYVSTPYHGSTLSALNPEGFASSLTLRSITMNPVTTCCKSGDEEEKVMPNRNKYFDITLLKDPLYLIILISNSTNAISYTNFIILLPSYAVLLGFDKSMAAWLISIVSALDLVGRIGGSALSDTELLPKQWYFIGGLLISGISLTALPSASSYVMLSVYCGIFGLASGVYVGVTAVIMADMLGTERLTSTYGISLFVNGILQLIGPPLCGVWYEQSGTYIPLFTTLGIVLIIGASIWIFVPFIKKRQQQELADEETRS